MKWVEPKVFKIGETSINRDEIVAFLKMLGADEWMAKQPWRRGVGYDPASALIEIAGRSCYKSFGVGLNPNITKIREDSKDYISNVVSKGDGSVLEHAQVSWALADVSRVFCYSADTEVLTDEGWKPWSSVRGDERFASMTPYGELVFEPAEERFVGRYDGPMYQVRSEQVDLLVTPDHRMWVKSIDTRAYRRHQGEFSLRPASEILHRRVRYQKGGSFWRGAKPALTYIPGTSRRFRRRDRPNREVVRLYDGVSFPAMSFSKFLGFYLAEGSLGNPDTSINLAQNPGPILDHMTRVVNELGLRASTLRAGVAKGRKLTFKHLALYDWLRRETGGKALTKRVPGLVHAWPAYLIRTFLDALVMGDGNIHATNGHRVLYTSSRELADDVQILALKAGVAANIREDARVESHRIYTGAVIRKTRPNYIVSFLGPSRLYPHVNLHRSEPWPNRFRGPDGFDDRFVPYSGKVYCVKVAHGLLYVRRRGKPCWSGNTHELVRHRAGTAISQESLRYVRPKELRMTLVPGSELAKMGNLDELTRVVEANYEAYQKFAEREIRGDMKFDEKKAWTSALRRMLPDGIATNIVWTANHRTLRWVLEMRTSPGAEVEMRYVFDKVGDILQRDYPLLYGDFLTKPHADGVGRQWIPQLRSKV